MIFIFWLYLYFKKMDDKRIDRVAQIILIAIVVAIFYTASIGGNLVWEHGVELNSLVFLAFLQVNVKFFIGMR